MAAFLRTLMKPLSRPLSWVGNLTLAVLRRIMANGGTATASQFAYNTLLATIPFLFVIFTAINFNPDAYVELFEALKGTIPGIEGLTETFQDGLARGTAAGFVIVVAVIAALYVASNAIGALVDGLDRAQHLNHRPWIKAKVVNFGFAAAASVLAAASTLALAGGQKLVVGLSDLLDASDRVRNLADRLALPVAITTLFLFTMLIYRFGPNGVRLRWRHLFPGALLSVSAWYGLTILIGLYADAFNNLDAVYGTLGGLFVYLTFLYFTGLMFLTGAELNAELAHRRLVRAAQRDSRDQSLEMLAPGPPDPESDEATQSTTVTLTPSDPAPGGPRFPRG